MKCRPSKPTFFWNNICDFCDNWLNLKVDFALKSKISALFIFLSAFSHPMNLNLWQGNYLDERSWRIKSLFNLGNIDDDFWYTLVTWSSISDAIHCLFWMSLVGSSMRLITSQKQGIPESIPPLLYPYIMNVLWPKKRRHTRQVLNNSF